MAGGDFSHCGIGRSRLGGLQPPDGNRLGMEATGALPQIVRSGAATEFVQLPDVEQHQSQGRPGGTSRLVVRIGANSIPIGKSPGQR